MKNYTLEEGLDSLDRIKLMMKYSLDKTNSENRDVISEQLTQNQVVKSAAELVNPAGLAVGVVRGAMDDKYDQPEGTKKIMTPSGGYAYIPSDAKVTIATAKDYNPASYPSLKGWLGKKRGGNGNDMSDSWIPRDLSDSIKENSVTGFILSNGKQYTMTLVNTELFKIKSDEEYYKATPKPFSWEFAGYYDNQGNPYKLEKVKEHTVGEFIGHWVRENRVELAWIAGAIIAGILTGGVATAIMGTVAAESSVLWISRIGFEVSKRALVSYLAEATVWGVKGGISWREGDKEGAVIDWTFGFLLPVVHGVGINKLGLGYLTEAEVKTLGQKLTGKSASQLEELWTKSAAEGGLTIAEKKAVQKVLTIPAKKWEEALVPIYKDASAKLIERGLNPKEVMNEVLLKAGGFLTKSWYTKIPTYLVHDIPFLHLVDSIAKKFGVNNVSKELTEKIGQGYEDAKKNGKGDDYIEKSVNIIKQSKDINEFEKKSLKKMTIDTVGSGKKLKQIKNYDQLLKTQNERYKDKNNANVDLNSLINQ
jgi:hypothetical protein